MGNIKQVLRERWYAWEDARKLAKSDPSVYTNEENELCYDEDLDESLLENEKDAREVLDGSIGSIGSTPQTTSTSATAS
jgi:hypothetical protein